MSILLLLLGETKVFVPILALVTKCPILLQNLLLLMSPYPVHSVVSAYVFQLLSEAIIGASPEIPREKASEFAIICEKFGFSDRSQVPESVEPTGNSSSSDESPTKQAEVTDEILIE
jgi:hypothetical protein